MARPDARRLRGEDLAVQRLARRRAERAAPRQALVQRHPQGVDVRSPIDRPHLGTQLLGRHVVRRPEDVRRLGQSQALIVFTPRVRDTEVEHDRAAVPRHHEVAGLQVAMHEATLVRDVQGTRRGLEERHDAQNLVALSLRGDG